MRKPLIVLAVLCSIPTWASEPGRPQVKIQKLTQEMIEQETAPGKLFMSG
jgi:hypothetical protein